MIVRPTVDGRTLASQSRYCEKDKNPMKDGDVLPYPVQEFFHPQTVPLRFEPYKKQQ